MLDLSSLGIALYTDGADYDEMLHFSKQVFIDGLTTNPTLLHAAGVTDYERFAHEILKAVTNKPISFEVFADELDEMKRQALKIQSWGDNVYVKIPICNSLGKSTVDLISDLDHDGVKLNITAVMTEQQVLGIRNALSEKSDAIISIFAGRIADTGRDPVPLIKTYISHFQGMENIKILWASTREILNILHAQQAGCNIITVPPALLKKLESFGKDLELFSVETVQMFLSDANRAGFDI